MQISLPHIPILGSFGLVLVTFIVAIESLLCGCRASCVSEELTRRTETYSKANPENVPIIVVAQITSYRVPDSEWRPGRYGAAWPTRRYRMKIKVENVLQGNLPRGETQIYFWSIHFVSGSEYPIAFPAGDREILFMQKDCDRLRTICDDWVGCCSISLLWCTPGL